MLCHRRLLNGNGLMTASAVEFTLVLTISFQELEWKFVYAHLRFYAFGIAFRRVGLCSFSISSKQIPSLQNISSYSLPTQSITLGSGINAFAIHQLKPPLGTGLPLTVTDKCSVNIVIIVILIFNQPKPAVVVFFVVWHVIFFVIVVTVNPNATIDCL